MVWGIWERHQYLVLPGSQPILGCCFLKLYILKVSLQVVNTISSWLREKVNQAVLADQTWCEILSKTWQLYEMNVFPKIQNNYFFPLTKIVYLNITCTEIFLFPCFVIVYVLNLLLDFWKKAQPKHEFLQRKKVRLNFPFHICQWKMLISW